MQTALLAGGITLIFLIISAMLNEASNGLQSVTLYFVIVTWISGVKK